MAEAGGERQPGLARALRGAVLGIAMLVAACVGPPGGRAPESAPPVPVPAPRERPVERPISPGLPQDAERHRVALLVPLTGSNAGIGKSLANATQLAILDSKNDALRITTYDTTGPGGPAAAAKQAIAEGNALILGPLLAEEARVVAPIAHAAHVPVLSFSNDVSAAGGGTYIMGYLPSQSIDRVVEYARGVGVTQFAGLVPAGVYGERVSTAFLRAVESHGGSVVALETYGTAPGALTAAIAKIGHAPFQAVLLPGNSGSATVAVPLIRKSPAGKTARLLGTDQWNNDSGIGANAALSGAWFASVPDTLYRRYAVEYRNRFGAAPYRLSTIGYDSVLLTIRIAREWRAGDVFPERRLTQSDGFVGLDGAFRFGSNGVAERALEVQEIRGGAAVTVSPAPTGFGN